MNKLLEKYMKMPSSKKKQMIAATVITASMTMSMVTYAWLSNDKKAASMVKVNAPTTITIGAGGKDASEMINLSNIDVEARVGGQRVYEGEYVFCVKGKYVSQYDLQIARTTNIPFTYEVYRVAEVPVADAAGDSDETKDNKRNLRKGWGTTDSAIETGAYGVYNVATYIDSANITYYYPYVATPVSGGDYVNGKDVQNAVAGKQIPVGKKDNDGDNNNGEVYHEWSYGNKSPYQKVNQYAEPLYWQAPNQPIGEGKEDNGEFVNYYVLKITWGASFSNNKETDMIYITARRSG